MDERSYGSKEFWERRYEGTDASEEWLLPWANLAPALVPKLAATDALIVLGSGTSTIGEQLWDAGFTDVIGIDFAATAVNAMNARAATRPGLRYVEGDVRALPLADNSVDVAVDKGTLDALACTDDPIHDIAKMSAELERVLRPNGRWLVVSMRAPRARLDYFAGWGKGVVVERIDKPTAVLTGRLAALREQALREATEEERLEQTSCWLYVVTR